MTISTSTTREVADQRQKSMTSERLRKLLASPSENPSVSIVIPVNAQGDLEKVWDVLGDISTYSGDLLLEVVLLINNYDEAAPPDIDSYEYAGINVAMKPSVRKAGEAIGFTARLVGSTFAHSEDIVSFDADCRISNPTALLDWYAEQFQSGASLAYTHVKYNEIRASSAVLAQIAIHHLSRWVKRSILRIPTARGSNYGFRRLTVQRLYEQGMLADEMNVGPAIRSTHGKIAYSGRHELCVLTSARMFEGGWSKLARYLNYRLRYNLRVIKVRTDAAHHTGRERDPVRKFIDGRPMR